MGLVVTCETCGKRLSISDALYESRVRGRVVMIACKRCGARVRADGTQDAQPSEDAVGVENGDAVAITSIPPGSTVPPPAEAAPEEAILDGNLRDPWLEIGQGSQASAPHELLGSDETRPAPAEPEISMHGPTAKIGRYALFGQFAAGGMATVHLGRLDGAGGFSRVVAIKRLLPHLVKDREFTEMLLKEARLAARVRHPNVVPTLDVVASKGDVLLVLEYVHGESLGTLCRVQAREVRDFIPVEIVVSVMQGVLQGLHAVHEAVDEKGRPLELIHRDVSPPNVMVGADGLSRVLDFGIAKALEKREESHPNQLKGKTGYMSPEQIRGERLTRRSDVFATGIILWELLTMRRLFSAPSETERMAKITSGNYPRPTQFRPDVSEALDAAVMKALAFDPEQRFPTVLEFSQALESSASPAPPRLVTEWVNSLCNESLNERAKLVAEVENWRGSSPDIELSSTPFASEAMTLARGGEELEASHAKARSASTMPPKRATDDDQGRDPSRKAKRAKPKPKTELKTEEKNGSGLLWTVMLLAIAGVIALLALRG